MNLGLQEIGVKQRIISIDILRGIAILGIFLMNIMDFHSPYIYIDPLTWWNENPDHTLYILMDIFVQASFYPLFAFLFGYGAVILSERCRERGISFPKLFSRRLSVLFFIGCIHAFLIWNGDILITYAVSGFAILLVYKWRGKYLLLFGTLLYMIPMLLMGLLMIVLLVVAPEELSMVTDFDQAEHAIEVYQNGSFSEIFVLRWTEWRNNNFSIINAIVLFLSIFPLFLIGAGFAKLKWIEKVRENQGKLIWIASCCAIIGGGLKLLPYITTNNYGTMYFQDQFGGPLVALFYITTIVLLLENKRVMKMMAPLANVGRLSMSQYLFQSILCTLIFYSYGLGYYGKISYTAGIILVVVIYLFQVVLSGIWLRYFQLGPIEYLWRYATYGKKPAMKRITVGRN